jgi:hypothetical protein
MRDLRSQFREIGQIHTPRDRVYIGGWTCAETGRGYPGKTTEIKFYECRFTVDVLSLVWKENGFCRALVFEEWCLTIFLADVPEQRVRMGYGEWSF